MENKKLIFVLYFFLIFALIPFATSDPSFKVITPADDQMFTVGDNTISWDPPTPENITHVRIELYKGFDYIKAIDTWVDNTGTFTWTLNETDAYEYGTDYKIKITASIFLSIYGWSEYFCINLHPTEPIEPIIITIDTIATIIMIVLLSIVITLYYDKKTHKIQNWLSKIRKKLREKRNKSNV